MLSAVSGIPWGSWNVPPEDKGGRCNTFFKRLKEAKGKHFQLKVSQSWGT